MKADDFLTPEDIAEIVAILDGSTYDRIDIRTSRFSLRVARAGDGWTQEWNWDAPGSAPADSGAAAGGAAEEPVDDCGLEAIRAPLPGTFYRAPQPGAPPFVQVGDVVERDTVVGIVETMKLMSPVHAGVNGEIAAILVENAAQVEGDAVLMRVRPASA
jgi:acetyl-CoA carboxylase biotin carboxyl carrier protein